MAAIGSCWASGSWVSAGGWAAGTWAGSAPVPPVVVTPPAAGGGRRIYDPDNRRKHSPATEYRKLSRRERDEIEAMLRENAEPRYLAPAPPPARVTKRAEPIVIAPPDYVPPAPRPLSDADRVGAARAFMALDALEGFLDAAEQERPAREREVLRLHAQARQHAARLAAEQQRMAAEQADHAERQRMEAAAERQRIADEEEMLNVLLAIHELA